MLFKMIFAYTSIWEIIDDYSEYKEIILITITSPKINKLLRNCGLKSKKGFVFLLFFNFFNSKIKSKTNREQAVAKERRKRFVTHLTLSQLALTSFHGTVFESFVMF